MPKLTLAITAHAETVVAGPTMRSVRAALDRFATTGAEVELLIGLDTSTEKCRSYMMQEAFSDFERHEFQFRDQGKARNALARSANGHFLAFLDADDLFSENWLLRAVETLEQPGNERAIVHPEMNWQFDGIQNVYANPAQDHPFFSPLVMSAANYYDAMCVAPRRVWEELPYADRDVEAGYAFEDYQWFVEATALGWKHVIAPDTIIFKRRRDSSQTHESRSHSVLIRTIEPLAIDRLAQMTKTGAEK